jgi:hypothetical protein
MLHAMRRTQASLAIAVLLGTAGAADAVIIIGGSVNNGNFDATYPELIVDNPDPTPDFFLPKPTVWINEGTRALTGPYEDELSSEPWAGPAPTPVTTDGSGAPGPNGCNGLDCGVFFKAFSGNLANGPATGHLYQDNPAVPGWTYTLTGWVGAEANFLAAGAELAIEFLDAGNGIIGGTVLDLLPTIYVDNGQPFDYKQYSLNGVAPAGTVNVRARVSMLGGTPNPAGGGQAFVVDDFTLEGVPEPTTAAITGVLLGLAALRRRS